MASDSQGAILSIPLHLWAKLVLQLRRRSAGHRESGAFLLGPENGASGRITAFICYDDLDPNAYQSGAIAFHADGYAALWEHCRRKQLGVRADVHTHPSASVRQSPVDQKNPMVPVQGHVAIILPHFAHTPWWSTKQAGVQEYIGSFKWRTAELAEKHSRIKLTLW